MPNSILSEAAPDGYSILHSFRSPTASHPAGGGLAFIHRNNIEIKSVHPAIHSPSSFELQVLRITSCNPCVTVVNAYRPPDRSLATFQDEFQDVISTITASTTDQLLICGDLNAPGFDDHSINLGLQDALDTLGLEQHVRSPTRNGPDHLLDLIITDQNAKIIRDVRVVDSGFISDHQLILASLHTKSTRSSNPPMTFTYRPIKSVDPVDFESRLRRSTLFSSPANDAESFSNQIEEVVTATLDEIAPLQTRSRRPPKEVTRWLSDEAVEAKRQRRRLERRWKETRDEADRYAYRRACRRANKLINASRRDYFKNQLTSATDCKQRWRIAKEVLHSTKTVPSRSVDDLKQLCSKFSKYFIDKISSLKLTIAATLAGLHVFPSPDPMHLGGAFDTISHVSVDEVRGLITSMPSKSSSVDFIPTSLLKRCPSVFSELIARLANLSFTQGIFPTKFKFAAVTPLLKKPSLDPDNPASYRPISNLNNISKILERLFLSRLYPHVTSSTNFDHSQSAYRPHHSTETALLHTFDGIFTSADQSQPTLLVSLDLSAAFDTIDHSTLLSRLSTSFGVNGTALAWLTSYLSNRSQTIRIGSVSSDPSTCFSGVPQGSVLGPILFSLYISPIGKIVSSHGISHQQYADDAQLYISLKSSNINPSVERLETCLSALRSWLCFNGLCLNPDKSESILLGTHQRLRTFPPIPPINISNTEVRLSNQITSLGVIMDSALTFNAHITALCKACNFHLRSLRHIRRSLTDDIAVMIAVALVQSRLDYCNSLLFNISTYNLNKLQRVQNLAARVSINDWHSPTQQILSKLHWLPILSRIKFKICTITYKALANNQPANLRSLLNYYAPPRLLRSSDQLLLSQRRTRTSIGQRAFSACAPNIWNSLPLSIRLSQSLASFKRNLKTFYFAPS